jgi:hypothetical protein
MCRGTPRGIGIVLRVLASRPIVSSAARGFGCGDRQPTRSRPGPVELPFCPALHDRLARRLPRMLACPSVTDVRAIKAAGRISRRRSPRTNRSGHERARHVARQHPLANGHCECTRRHTKSISLSPSSIFPRSSETAITSNEHLMRLGEGRAGSFLDTRYEEGLNARVVPARAPQARPFLHFR